MSFNFAALSGSLIRRTSPSASRIGRARSRAASSPAANSSPLPVSIAVMLPSTGHSTNFAPVCSITGCSSLTTSGPAVLISINTWSRAALTAPPSPRYAARIAPASVRIETTISASSTASAGAAATRPTPSVSARSRVRFHSVSSWPSALSRRAIAPPILPVPRIATRITASSSPCAPPKDILLLSKE